MRISAGWLLAGGLLVALSSGGAARAAESGPTPTPSPNKIQALGNWLTEKKEAVIQISLGVGGMLEGHVLRNFHPAGSPHVAGSGHPAGGGDFPQSAPSGPVSPDPAALGDLILRDMNYVGAGNWSGGTIRDPRSGRSYQAKLQLVDAEHLNVRGFIGVEFLGHTQVWTRYHGER